VSPFPSEEEGRRHPSSSSSNTTRMLSRDDLEDYREEQLTETIESPWQGAVNNEFLKPDEATFVRLCEHGQIYEYLMDRMEIPVRTWVKEGLFGVIYGRNSARSELKAEFQEMFPNVAEVIKAHKKKDYAYLPCLMQNIEANFVINTVCRRIMDQLPEVPVYSIHDSVLTTKPFVDDIRQIIMEEFERLGLHPTLHIKDYGEAY